MAILFYEDRGLWVLETAHTAYVLGLDEERNVQQVYWGSKLPYAGDYPKPTITRGHSSFDNAEGMAPLEYPAWGGTLFTEPCIKATFSNATRVFKLEYASFAISPAVEAGGTGLMVELRSRLSEGLKVRLHYKVFEQWDVIEKHVEVINGSNEAITLENVQSGVWYLPEGQQYRMTHLTGKWAGETQIRQTNLTEGKKIIESRRGTTSPHANPWFAIDEGAAEEDYGKVWFGALGWSGNWKIAAEQTPFGQLKVTGGIHEFDFSWYLKPGEGFTTPVFTGGFTGNGFGQASRLMHSYQAGHILPKEHAGKLRKVLYNSWEATYFNVNEQDQIALAEKAAAIGVELFVIDDGWFGARNADNAGLGDWVVNREKFPRGLTPMIQKVNELGMDFGIWVEPEMVNPDSDLYRLNPDWVYHFPGVPRTEARNQLVLNLAKPEVKDYLIELLDRLLGENNIRFVKWDMNRHFTEPGWPDAPAELQREMWVRHTWSIYEIVDRLKAKHPQVVFEACSGGGGRVDIGVLSHMDQFWPSDNTDAFDRLKIQEGYSLAYCTKAMMAWVTESPNFLNGRELSIDYRFHSAMMGSLGIGANLNHWKDDELNRAKELVAQYKQIRKTVQEGLLYRLVSPRKGSLTAVEYVARDGSEAVVFAFLQYSSFGMKPPDVRLKGLEEKALYKSELLEEPLSGAALMQRGIDLGVRGNYNSRIIRFERL